MKPLYEDTLASSTILRLITTSEFNSTFTGYSYTIQDFNGDGSNVVFTTNTDSVNRLKNKMNSIYKVSDMNMPDRHLQKDMSNQISQTLMSSELTSKQIETNVTKQQNFESNVEIFNVKKPLPQRF